MKVWKIRQYLPALLLYIQRRVEGERGAVISVRTRDVCGVDRRCGKRNAPGKFWRNTNARWRG